MGVNLGGSKSTERRIATATTCVMRLLPETSVLLPLWQKSQEFLLFHPKNSPAVESRRPSGFRGATWRLHLSGFLAAVSSHSALPDSTMGRAVDSRAGVRLFRQPLLLELPGSCGFCAVS